MSRRLAKLLLIVVGSSGIDYHSCRLPRKFDMDCTRASKCVCCEAGSERKCRISMCSCADNGLFLDTAASSPNLSQVADICNTSAKARNRDCVGMDSPVIHLRAACTLIARSLLRSLNARCSPVALTGISHAANAAFTRSANCARSCSAGFLSLLFIANDHD